MRSAHRARRLPVRCASCSIPCVTSQASSGGPSSVVPNLPITRNASAACIAPMMPTVGEKTPMVEHATSSNAIVRLGTRMRSREIRPRRKSKVLIWPSKRSAAPDTERHAVGEARGVDSVARGEVIGAIEYDGGAWDVGVEPRGIGAKGCRIDLHARVERGERVAGGVHLGFTDRCHSRAGVDAGELVRSTESAIDQRDLTDTPPLPGTWRQATRAHQRQ